MAGLTSKAINKAREDGVKSLLLEGPPFLYRRLHRTDFLYRNIYRRFVKIKHSQIKNPNAYTHISPNDINYLLIDSEYTRGFYTPSKMPLHKMEKGRFNPFIFAGIILSGDWDLYKKPYKFDRVYSGLYQHYEQGDPLEETEYMWQYRLRGISRKDDEYLERQIHNKKSLYADIQEHGFQTQYELEEKEDGEPVFAKPWPISINIGRNGELIFNNTAHNRLAMSKLLDIDEIPVLVVVRHQKWQSVRMEVKHTDDFNKLSEDTKAVIGHPDLQEFASDDWPST
ncbi:hypothetical protein AB7C87_01645 [Natrarchaeobius sp. A-rgal3]|uniref:hypothetical protein n=1 Tax=Natrarchaeobius versutus TaxID=1679078 RepID=UPI00350EA36D